MARPLPLRGGAVAVSGPDPGAYAVDPLRYLATAAGLVQEARGGVVLHADGEIAPLPRLDGRTQLAPGSPALIAAASSLRRVVAEISTGRVQHRGAQGVHDFPTVCRAPGRNSSTCPRTGVLSWRATGHRVSW